MSFINLLTNTLDLLEAKGLFANINKRRKKGISRSKSKSTIDPHTYQQMRTWGEDIQFVDIIVKEALDQPVDIKWVSKSQDFWKGRFYIDNAEAGTSYAYEIDIMKLDDENPAWDISFYMTAENDKYASEFDDPNWATYSITGTGKSGTVFATVLAAIRQWIESEDPDVFHLAALEDSRVRLYNALFKRFLPKEWRVAFVDDEFWAAKNADPVVAAKQYAL